MKQFCKQQQNNVNDFIARQHMRLMEKTTEYAQNPFQRRLLMWSAGVTFLGLTMSSAYAENGVAGMVSKATSQSLSIKNDLIKIFGAAGVGLSGYGGYNWWRKGKEGERSDIKAGQIFWPVFGGAALASTSFLMLKFGESIGLTQSDAAVVP